MASDMQSYTTELEARVERRTQELSRVNEALEDSNKELESAVDKLAEMARTDGLTGLLNRRALKEALEVEIRRSDREGQQFSFLMIDVDFFKKYNDAFGHPAGDKLLIRLSSILQENTRAVDVVARFGGEEFVVLLSGTPPSAAVAVAEKLREAVKNTVFRPATDGKPVGRTSVSIGIAGYPSDSKTKQGLMSLADQALYLAKEAGRDLVVKCGSGDTDG
jgi:diguanylate cyclase (GGDEF)-like protein